MYSITARARGAFPARPGSLAHRFTPGLTPPSGLGWAQPGQRYAQKGLLVTVPAVREHVSSRQAFIWPYDERARLIGENLYEDKTSLHIEKVDPAEATTPARVREIHLQQLARLEQQRGDKFWALNGG